MRLSLQSHCFARVELHGDGNRPKSLSSITIRMLADPERSAELDVQMLKLS